MFEIIMFTIIFTIIFIMLALTADYLDSLNKCNKLLKEYIDARCDEIELKSQSIELIRKKI